METRVQSLSALDGVRRDRSDARRVLTSLGEIAYEWSLPGDRLLWGANFADVLGLEPGDGFATGAEWESVCAPIDGSRASAIAQAQKSANSNGVYNLRYRVRAGAGAQSFIVDDSGRWFAGADGRPARVHGLVRMSAAPTSNSGPNSRSGARRLDQTRFMETLARACAAGGRERFALLLLPAREGHVDSLQKVMRAGDAICVRDDGALALLLRHCEASQVERAFARFAAVAADVGAEFGVLTGGAVIGGHDCAGARTLMRRAEQALATCSAIRPLVVRDASTASDDGGFRAICEEIVAALDGDRVFIALQPIVDAQTGAPAFYEALVRIRSADGAVSGPGGILPAAEASGLVADLDQRVLELALAYLDADDGAGKILSVNVSGASLRDPAWPARVEAALGGRETLARQLVLEVTETAAIADLEASARALNHLRALGCRIAMDDFGAGHTSFRNLRALKIDIVKIDGAFVRNLVDSQEDQFFVRTLHELAKRIGARTVAEWVENAQCASLLAQWGVDYLQGAHYGMPLDIMCADIMPMDLRHDLEAGRP